MLDLRRGRRVAENSSSQMYWLSSMYVCMYSYVKREWIYIVMGALLHLPSSTIMYYTILSHQEETLVL